MNRFFKIFLTAAFSVSFLICLVGCQKTKDYTENISQLRENIYTGEFNDYSLTILPEKREKPFVADGSKGEMSNIIILSLSSKVGLEGDYSIFFTLDKEYTVELKLDIVQNAFTASIEVDELPLEPLLTVTVKKGEENFNVDCYAKRLTETAFYQKALDRVIKSRKSFIDSLTVDDKLQAEIFIRLLCERDKNYWYVGIVKKTTTTAFLLDGKATEILAEKELENQ